MADSEKLTALKKAYAEIILNTAKDAAARVMVSERKALRYQKDLFGAKDEALYMLLRLKQMLDSKVLETEMASVNQQRKIDELEAQLQEAEDIVKDLREELREVQDELEKERKNHERTLNQQNLSDSSTILGETSQENGSLPVTTTEVRNSTSYGTCYNIKFDGSNGSLVNHCYLRNPDFASILKRRKEPELYRNGCTQRIRACESTMLDGKLPISGEVDTMKNQTRASEDGVKMIHLTPTLDNDTVCRVEKKQDDFESVQQEENSSIRVQAVKSVNRKRKRAIRYKKSRSSSRRCFGDRVTETCQPSNHIPSESYMDLVDVKVQDGEISSQIGNEVEKDQLSHLAQEFQELPQDTMELLRQSGCSEVAEGDAEFHKGCSTPSTMNNDNISISNLTMKKEEGVSVETVEVQACKTGVEALDVSIVNYDPKEASFGDGVPSQPVNSRPIKYTFQRMRKKSLSSSEGTSSLDMSTLKRKTGEKENGTVERDSSLLTESSRESRRLAQVARQLISLSDKKWA